MECLERALSRREGDLRIRRVGSECESWWLEGLDKRRPIRAGMYAMVRMLLLEKVASLRSSVYNA